MTDRELMQRVLDALNDFDKGNHGMRWQVPLIKALRARLSQPEPAECDGGQCGIGGYCKQCPKAQLEQEPVGINEVILDSIRDSSEVVAPPQREWVGLTDDEIDKWNIVGHESLREFVRAIEAKLKEKNGY